MRMILRVEKIGFFISAGGRSDKVPDQSKFSGNVRLDLRNRAKLVDDRPTCYLFNYLACRRRLSFCQMRLHQVMFVELFNNTSKISKGPY